MKTILAAYYAKFEKLSYGLDSDIIGDEIPVSLLIGASGKDNLVWNEARVSAVNFNCLRRQHMRRFRVWKRKAHGLW